MNYDDVKLINNTEAHNFELFVDEQLSFIDYKMRDNKVYLIHTEVPAELQGKGVAEALVTKAFDYAEQHQLKVVPLCSYVQAFLKRHPEWNKIVA